MTTPLTHLNASLILGNDEMSRWKDIANNVVVFFYTKEKNRKVGYETNQLDFYQSVKTNLAFIS